MRPPEPALGLAEQFTHLVTVGESLLLVGDEDALLLDSPLLGDVVRLLDGRRTAVEIAEMLAEDHRPEMVHFVLLKMEREGVVVAGNGGGIETGRAGPGQTQGRRAETGRIEARRTKIGQTEDERTEAEKDRPPGNEPATAPSSPLAEELQWAWERREKGGAGEAGSPGVVHRLEADPGKNPWVLLADDYLHPGLVDLRSREVPEGEPCLLLRPGGKRVWVGPWVMPGDTACLACLQERLRINLVARAFLHLPPEVAATQRIRMEALVREIPLSSWEKLAERVLEEPAWGELAGPEQEASAGAELTGPRLEETGLAEPDGPEREASAVSEQDQPAWPAAETRIRVLSPEGEPPEVHRVARLPHCSACGDPSAGPPGARFRIRKVPIRSESGGGYRSEAPEGTIRRLERFVSPLTGVIRHVRKVPVAGAREAHVYTANHPNYYGAASFRTLRADRRDHSGGKGMADTDARASAMCEAVERFSAVHRGTEAVFHGRRSDLAGESVHPNDLLLFSHAQYAGREAWNQEHGGGFQYVPEPYRDQAMEWCQARSLVDGRICWVPAAAVFLGFRGEGGRFCAGDSNGLASGNTQEEAILQGLLELVERDAVAIWWYNRLPLPALDLATFHDPRVRATEKIYPRLERDLWALDLTTDLGIPAFAALSALSARTSGEAQDIIFGFGAHLDPTIALLRALSEVNQMLPTVQRSMEERRRQLLPTFPEALEWWETATLEGHPYLLPTEDLPSRTQTDFASPGHSDLAQALYDCVRAVRGAGGDILVYELTRPDVQFPVARVLAPGLRHFWRRLGPGRLYDVPVGQGWRGAPLREDQVNPVSMFV